MTDVGVVCRFKTTQVITGTCRADIIKDALIQSAVRDGLGAADEFEELRMTLAEYDQFMADYATAHPLPDDPRWALVRSFALKMINLGFTKAELKAVFSYLKDRFD